MPPDLERELSYTCVIPVADVARVCAFLCDGGHVLGATSNWAVTTQAPVGFRRLRLDDASAARLMVWPGYPITISHVRATGAPKG